MWLVVKIIINSDLKKNIVDLFQIWFLQLLFRHSEYCEFWCFDIKYSCSVACENKIINIYVLREIHILYKKENQRGIKQHFIWSRW